MKRFRWEVKYLYWGITAFLVIVCSISFFALLQSWPAIFAVIKKIISILSPIFWGFAIAYLLNPVMMFFERLLFAPLGKKIFKKNEKRARMFGRVASASISVLLFVAIIVTLCWLVLPQIYFSVANLVDSMDSYVRRVTEWFSRLTEKSADNPSVSDSFFSNTISSVIDQLTKMTTGWMDNDLLASFTTVLSNITTGVYNVIRGLFNLLLGIVISIYMLYSKESFSRRIKKLLYAVLPKRAYFGFMRGIRYTDRVFLSFIGGKLLDSLIIGVLCYIFCAIAGMPYALLIAVIIGVTNIVPFFGPFIGAVPSALLVLTDSGTKFIIFVVFIIILQQFDGNILGPRVIGNRTGMSGFWILFSILLGGGLFGVLGMLLGIPVFSVIYTAISYAVNRRLKKREMKSDFIENSE